MGIYRQVFVGRYLWIPLHIDVWSLRCIDNKNMD
jgi:hypothetical protein